MIVRKLLGLRCLIIEKSWTKCVCDWQIVISQSEQKDGSGWPFEYEDLESGDVVIPGDLDVTEKISPENGHRATILVWYLHVM